MAATGRCIALQGTRERVLIVAGVAAFAVLFQRVTADVLSPEWAYQGLRWQNIGPIPVALLTICAITPAFWAPARLTRPSHFAWWTLFLCVYVPSTLVPARSILDMESAFELNAALLAGIAILSAAHRLQPIRLPRLIIPAELFWLAICALTIGLCAWTALIFGSHLRLVSLSAMYDQRLQARGLANETGASYALQILKCVIAPLFLAHGITHRKPAILAVGCAIIVFMYAIAANKSVLFAALIALLLGAILRRPDRHFGVTASWGTALAWVVPCLIPLWSINPVGRSLSAVVHYRLFALPGLLTGWWVEFFSRNPWTYFGHVKGLGTLVECPYSATLPLTIGKHFIGSPLINANSSLWADGFAGFGYGGLLLVSAAAACTLWLMDSASIGLDARFATIAFSFQAMNLADGSLFSTLFGNGLALTILLILLMPRPGEERALAIGIASTLQAEGVAETRSTETA